MNVSSFFNTAKQQGQRPWLTFKRSTFRIFVLRRHAQRTGTPMAGDERIRRCSECNLNVYNLSAMTEHEVQRLVADSQGRLWRTVFIAAPMGEPF